LKLFLRKKKNCLSRIGVDSHVGNDSASFDVLELVPTTLVEFSFTRAVEADITVNDFDADARFSLAQHPSSDLFERPLLVDHQSDDFLSLLDTEFAVLAIRRLRSLHCFWATP